MKKKNRICIFSGFRMENPMNGFAIRYLEMANLLKKKGFQVTLFSEEIYPGEGKKNRYSLSDKLLPLVREHDIFILQPDILFYYHPLLKNKTLIADLICPFHIEHFQKMKEASHNAPKYHDELILLKNMFLTSIETADLLLCGNETQKNLYIGMAMSIGIYDLNLEIVPFGVPNTSPESNTKPLRSLPGIQKEDALFLWWGGLWDWYDPFPLIDGFIKLRQNAPKVKLIFPGKNPKFPSHLLHLKTEDYVKQSGLYNKGIHFLDHWIPYDSRAAYLLDSYASVTSFPDSLETRFSTRIRNTDFLWSKLPIISSRGDEFSDLIRQNNWGIQVQEQSEESWHLALSKMLNPSFRKDCKKALSMSKNSFTWPSVFSPLLSFLKSPVKKSSSFSSFLPKKVNPILKKALIFGTSKAGIRAYYRAKSQKIQITCWLDNDPDKWHKTFEGKKIYPPDNLKKFKDHIIIIASFPGREAIEKQLATMGVPDNQMIWFGNL